MGSSKAIAGQARRTGRVALAGLLNSLSMEPVKDKTAATTLMPSTMRTLCDWALELGASDAIPVAPSQVVTAEWVRMKCLYGDCASGRCLSCPPYSPKPARTRLLLDEYERVLLLRLDVAPAQAGEWLACSRRLAAIALGLERELFLAGRYRAFALAGGRPCDLDEPCGRPEECDVRARVRPGPAGCGIDVFATSANAAWPLDVVHGPDDPYHLFALVLVD
jgi:predicted metal-binding protein